MNLYVAIGNVIGGLEARDLANRLVAWHDAMVKHLRAVRLRGAGCDDGCPHEDARLLWAEAMEIYGEEAGRLAFLKAYGAVPVARRATVTLEARA